MLGLSVWIFLSPLLAISICVVAKCCILTHKSLADKYGSKESTESESESDDDDLGRIKCRNNRRNKLLNKHGAKSHNSNNSNNQKKKKKKSASDIYAKFRRKSSKAPLLEPFNWDDLFPKHENENETEVEYSSGAAPCGQSENQKTSRDYLLSRNGINGYHSRRYGVFDKRKQSPQRPSYGCYTNMGRRLSNDPEATPYVDINRNRSGFHGDRALGNQDAGRRPTSGHHGNKREGARTDTSNHSNKPDKATHANLQTYNAIKTRAGGGVIHDAGKSRDGATHSCVQIPSDANTDWRYCNTVALPPLNGLSLPPPTPTPPPPPPPQSRFTYHSVGTLGMMMVTSSSSSLASSNQQQCFCDSSLHISLRCRQCQANWLADPAWRSRRSLLAPSSSGSLESERALSVDSAALSIAAGGKLWGAAAPTPPPPYDEALRAPEMVHRIELNNEGPPPYDSVYHVNTNSFPVSIATQQIQPDGPN